MKDKKLLIAQISQNVAPSTPAPLAPVPESEGGGIAPRTSTSRQRSKLKSGTPVTKPGASATGTGKQAAFWLDDEDRSIFHEVGMLLYSQGIKPSHNLVLRAAIRMLPRDHRLIENVRALIEKDGRKARHKRPLS